MLRRSPFRIALALVVLVPLAAHAWTQAPAKSPQSEMKKQFADAARASAPTPEHKALAPFVGDFDQATEVRMGPGEPMKAHSIAKGEWVMDGRFVKIDSHSAPDEELKGDRITVYGYDPVLKKYTLWTIDSMSSTASIGEGTYDPHSKTFTFDGERAGPGNSRARFRWTLKIDDAGVIAQEIAMKMGENYTPVVTVKHTPRKK
jgi:hypothetical protein